MFDFLKRSDCIAPEVPDIKPREVEPETIYSIGATDKDTHMTFKLGYKTLTMTKLGCQCLIDQLEVFKNQLADEDKDAT